MAVTQRESELLKAGPITWLFVFGVVLLFFGERVADHLDKARVVLSGSGAILALAATAWRATVWQRARGDRKRVERLLLLAHVGGLVALFLYGLGTPELARKIGVTFAEKSRTPTILQVLWPIVAAASLLPLVLAELADSAGRRGGVARREGDDAQVDLLRVSEAVSAGLTAALAGAFLCVVYYVAAERDQKIDLSYFRTAAPGTATQNMVASMAGEPLKVLLFYPEVNEVKDEVAGYFRELASRTGNKMQVEEHDRLLSSRLTRDYKVTRDGAIVFVRGTQNETIFVDPDMKLARARLRTLDEEVQKALFKVARGARVAYLTVGHGELNDPARDPEESREQLGLEKAGLFKTGLGLLNYQVKDLGLAQGLGSEIPEDAAVVVVLAPRKPFLPEELAALDRYLARGGALLLALDPAGGAEAARLGPLEARLGLTYDPTPLADDKQFVVTRRNPSDHRWIVTGQFSAHASVTTLSRSRASAGILAIEAGALADSTAAPPPEGKAKRTYVVRSAGTTFVDRNGNFTFEVGTDRRAFYNLVAAVEGPVPPAPQAPTPAEAGKEAKPTQQAFRAMVFADGQMFSDFMLGNVPLNGALVSDALKWLGGEETFAGETRSEKDVLIEHTRNQDQAWFYSTILGAPALVLSCGLAFVFRRRRGGRGAAGRRSGAADDRRGA